MKRFLAFSFASYYPGGGRRDQRGDFDTLDEAVTFFQSNSDDWMEVLDTQERQWYDVTLEKWDAQGRFLPVPAITSVVPLNPDYVK